MFPGSAPLSRKTRLTSGFESRGQPLLPFGRAPSYWCRDLGALSPGRGAPAVPIPSAQRKRSKRRCGPWNGSDHEHHGNAVQRRPGRRRLGFMLVRNDRPHRTRADLTAGLDPRRLRGTGSGCVEPGSDRPAAPSRTGIGAPPPIWLYRPEWPVPGGGRRALDSPAG